MMAWHITCSDPACDEKSGARDIVDLLYDDHRNEAGWFVCDCGKRGYIEKSFDLQEGGDPWQPFLQGAIPLGEEGDTYQPFVFLVSSSSDDPVESVWFSYYKDLRSSGGQLKLGYGPGGPPVLSIQQVRDVVEEVDRICRS
jgi:hypothetical protein